MASTTTLNVSDAYSKKNDGDNHDASSSSLLSPPISAVWSRNTNNISELGPSFFPMNYGTYKHSAYNVPTSSTFTPSSVFDVSSLVSVEHLQSAGRGQQHTALDNYQLQPQFDQRLYSNNSIIRTEMTSSLPRVGLDDLFPQGGVETIEASADTVAKYATFLLQRNSPEELRSSVDESLGPYITSILTEFIGSASAATKRALGVGSTLLEDAWNDYENVLELILEHCSMTSREVASQTLQEIFRAVNTRKVPVKLMKEYESYMDEQKTFLSHGILESGSDTVNDPSVADTYSSYHNQVGQHSFDAKDIDDAELENLVFGMMFQEQDEVEEVIYGTTKQAGASSEELNSHVPSYPIDGDIPPENRNSAANAANAVTLSNSPDSISSILENPATIDNKSQPPRPSKSNTSVKEQKKRNKAADDMLAKDVAAALFKPSRPRSNSNLSDSASGKRNSVTAASPKLMPQAAIDIPPPNSCFLIDNSSNGYYFPTGTFHHQEQDHYQDVIAQQIDATAEILLSIQSDLSTNAALTASMMAYGDVNVAYYLVEQALNAPPICRHMLQYACYRADCAFSHDVDGHTCTFWLKGRCGKGDSCRFLHGFNEALLKDIMDPMDQSSSNMVVGGISDQHQQNQGQTEDSVSSACSAGGGAIVTQNLLLHNEKQKKDYNTAKSSGSPFTTASPLPPGLLPPDSFLNSSWSSSSLQQQANTADNSSSSIISFAKVAATNNVITPPFSTSSSIAAAPQGNSISSNSLQKEKVIKIPLDLWTSSNDRDPSLFQIADPIERFNAVNNAQSRVKQAAAGLPYVIDLHFQSVKTAQLVLATVLPQKLEEISKLSQRETVKAAGVWIITGSGHHVNTQSHQKRNGVLENAVMKWLQDEGYEHFRGKDRNGYSGAIYVTAAMRVK